MPTAATTGTKTPTPEVDHVEVKDGRGRRRGCGSYAECFIKLPRFSRRRYYALHELGHVLVPDEYSSHGPEYAQVYIALVREFMGNEDAAKLSAAFEAYEVKVADGFVEVVEAVEVIEPEETTEVDLVQGALPDNLADLINEEHRVARAYYAEALQHAMRAGWMLVAKKAELKHGEFMPWVEANCEFSQDTANDYMKLYNRRDEVEANSGRAQNLSIRGALKALEPPRKKRTPKPKTVEEARPSKPVSEPDTIGTLSAVEKLLPSEVWFGEVEGIDPGEVAESLLSKFASQEDDGAGIGIEKRSWENLADFWAQVAARL